MSSCRTPLRALAALGLAVAASGQVQDGELLVNLWVGGGPGTLEHYRPDGTLVGSTMGGSGNVWAGAAVTDAGTWITRHQRIPLGFGVYDSQGSELAVHATPQVHDGALGDVSLFADGTLAISDSANGEVELFSPTGVHLGTLSVPGAVYLIGSVVDRNDELWLADLIGMTIWHLARDGTVLGSFPTTYRPGEIDEAPDGTLWVRGYNTTTVQQFATDGTPLGSFSSQAGMFSTGLAVAGDGTLWLTSFNTDELLHYDPNGTLLGRFDTGNQPYYLYLKRGLGSRYCSPASPNSTGSPGRISASGSALVASNDVTLTAQDLPPGEFGYFLVGSNMGQFQPPGSAGVICLTCSGFQGCAGIGRYNQVGNIVQGPAGSISIDLTALPLTPPRAVLAGETWNFQCWYRDLATNNFTDAVSITFR